MTTETTPPRETLLRRIQALLNKADATSFPEEKRTYTEKAAELMARHGVDEALLASRRDENEDELVHQTIDLTGRWYPLRNALLGIVAKNGGYCATFRTGSTAHLFGRKSDVDRVHIQFLSLTLQGMQGAACAEPPADVSAATFRRGWFGGFVAGVRERMEAAYGDAVKEAESRTTGSALVLVRRADQAAEFMRSTGHGTGIRAGTAGKGLNAAGYHQGKAAGGRADLGNARVGTRRRSIGA